MLKIDQSRPNSNHCNREKNLIKKLCLLPKGPSLNPWIMQAPAKV